MSTIFSEFQLRNGRKIDNRHNIRAMSVAWVMYKITSEHKSFYGEKIRCSRCQLSSRV